MNVPAVTVLMPVYNAEAYVAEAIESILGQTFTDFEFLIIDDSSTDATPGILERYTTRNSCIHVVRNEKNLNIGASLNRGLELASAPLVARMDADDVSLPHRLEKQVAFMAANPDVVVAGGCWRGYETGIIRKPPLTNDAIRATLLWTPPFCHPAVIMRRPPVLRAGGYRQEYPPTEDYDLWRRLAAVPDLRFANLDEVLIRYREHPGIDRSAYRARQRELSATVSRAYLLDLGMREDELDMDAHAVFSGGAPADALPTGRLQAWVARLIRLNGAKKICDPDVFASLCNERLHNSCVRAEWMPPGLKRLIPLPVKNCVKKCLFAFKNSKQTFTDEA
ncbi:MAG: glycosyltransferase [Desulfovibrio sp.]|nr:glycosyltransferase [Desulfovibrio sp.]